MIDLHCHILPGIDDGPKDLEAAIAMAKMAVSEGIEHILVTPHHRNGQYINKKKEIIEAMQAFQTILDMNAIPLNLFPGQELRLTSELLDYIDNDEVQFVDEDCQYLLIEFPTMSIPNATENLFFELGKRNITPIIVHPERNHVFYNKPDIFFQFIEKGAYAQLTAGSYLGHFGKKIQKFSKQLLDANSIHIIASDAHNISTRKFCVKEAYEKLEKEFGIGIVKEFQQNTKDFINGDAPASRELLKVRKKFKLF
ncbi:tyrosine-protein phosphatase [Isobaculum melis]|uniref:Tyrosine-protein phosphatase n=1 Tax=Isobaculum melis TaxID=142588 RepID=A0A1H9SLQ1_9LACT|nr:CpsB/CapC family capsule biosynthesis tyrosine phosphatase [Isobaculum melis]SER85808.1 protein-tyrosine phosphatase [Isobaculum melis]